MKKLFFIFTLTIVLIFLNSYSWAKNNDWVILDFFENDECSSYSFTEAYQTETCTGLDFEFTCDSDSITGTVCGSQRSANRTMSQNSCVEWNYNGVTYWVRTACVDWEHPAPYHVDYEENEDYPHLYIYDNKCENLLFYSVSNSTVCHPVDFLRPDSAIEVSCGDPMSLKGYSSVDCSTFALSFQVENCTEIAFAKKYRFTGTCTSVFNPPAPSSSSSSFSSFSSSSSSSESQSISESLSSSESESGIPISKDNNEGLSDRDKQIIGGVVGRFGGLVLMLVVIVIVVLGIIVFRKKSNST